MLDAGANGRRAPPLHLALAVILVVSSGCLRPPGPDAEPGLPTPTVPDAVELSGCTTYQGLFAVDAAAAQAMVAPPFVVAPFPGQGNPPAGDPEHAEMDVVFLRCESGETDEGLGAIEYHGIAFLVQEPPAPYAGDADLYYFVRGEAAHPPRLLEILRAWSHPSASEGRVGFLTAAPYPSHREVTAQAEMTEGLVEMRATLPEAEPLDRPAEHFRFFFGPGPAFASMDIKVGPHQASVGPAELEVRGGTGWLDAVPPPELAPVAAYAGSPGWDIQLTRTTPG